MYVCVRACVCVYFCARVCVCVSPKISRNLNVMFPLFICHNQYLQFLTGHYTHRAK